MRQHEDVAWILARRISGSIRALAAPALALGSGQTIAVPRLHLKETDEVAVMIDSRYPVEVLNLPKGVEDLGYVNSWQGRAAAAPA